MRPQALQREYEDAEGLVTEITSARGAAREAHTRADEAEALAHTLKQALADAYAHSGRDGPPPGTV